MLSWLRLLFGFWGEMMDPCFIYSNKSHQEVVRIGLKKVQSTTCHIQSCASDQQSEVSVPQRAKSFLISRPSVRME